MSISLNSQSMVTRTTACDTNCVAILLVTNLYVGLKLYNTDFYSTIQYFFDSRISKNESIVRLEPYLYECNEVFFVIDIDSVC